MGFWKSRDVIGSRWGFPVRLRSFLLALASIAIGIVLIASLVSVAKIDPRETLRQLGKTNRIAFTKLALLMSLYAYLSARKWRLMDAVIRRSQDAALPGLRSFALTTAGMALGQVLPIPISMAVARTLGMYDHDSPVTRGTVGTLFDQGFDFLIVCFLIPASVTTRLFKGGALMWMGVAAPMALLALLGAGTTVRWLHRIAVFFSAGKSAHPSRLQRGFTELQHSGLLNADLARKLVALSALRFVVLVLMAGETTEAISANVPLWHLAAAMPFVVFSNALAVTPGGLGVNEITCATALGLFGTALPAAAQWALANRFLMAAASFAVAICAAGILFLVNSRNRFLRKRRIR